MRMPLVSLESIMPAGQPRMTDRRRISTTTSERGTISSRCWRQRAGERRLSTITHHYQQRIIQHLLLLLLLLRRHCTKLRAPVQQNTNCLIKPWWRRRKKSNHHCSSQSPATFWPSGHRHPAPAAHTRRMTRWNQRRCAGPTRHPWWDVAVELPLSIYLLLAIIQHTQQTTRIRAT